MKHFFPILLFLLFSFSVRSQNTSFATTMNGYFQNVDRSRVQTGLLRDYGVDFVNPKPYEGLYLADTNYANIDNWYLLYKTIKTFRFNSSGPDLGNVNDIILAGDSVLKATGVVPMTVLLYQYDKYKDNAYEANLITVSNDKIYDKFVSGNWVNPYETQLAFAATPMVQSFKRGNVDFKLDPSYIFSNVSGTYDLKVDFADGQGYRSLVTSTVFNISYADTGYKEIKYKITLPNAQVIQSHSLIRIEKVQNLSSSRWNLAQVVHEIPGIYPGHDGCQLHVRFGTNHNHQIVKPLIVFKDFDPNGPHSDLNIGIDEFLEPLYNGRFGAQLRDLVTADYDVIFVNYYFGDGDILNNAGLVKPVVDWVRSQMNGGTEPNVILGMGMGALVARLGLKGMENASQNHYTRLFISYDAPNQGAHLPLGVQALNYYTQETFGLGFGNTESTGRLSDFRQYLAIRSLASTQMLRVYLAQYYNSNYSTYPVIDNEDHELFMAAVKTIGYPANCRNVAVSNGSQCGSAGGVAPGETLYNVSGHFSTGILNDINFTLNPYYIIESLVGIVMLHPQGIIRWLPGKSSLHYEYEVKATPASGQIPVCKHRVYIRKKFLWLVNFNVNIAQNEFSNLEGQAAEDGYSGSQVDFGSIPREIRRRADEPYYLGQGTFASIQNTLYASIAAKGIDNFYYAYPGTTTYISTVSALDIGYSSTSALPSSTYFEKFNAVVPPAGNKASPFVNFISASSNYGINEPHGSIWERNGDWIVAELNQTPQYWDCSGFCGLNPSIDGPNDLCSSGIYQILDAPSNSSVAWSAVPSTNVDFTNNGQVSTGANKGTDGPTVVYANLTNPSCQTSYQISKDIYSGPLRTQNIIGINDGIPLETNSYRWFSVAENSYSYTWQVYGGNITYGQGTNAVRVLLAPCVGNQNASNNVSVIVTLENSCGVGFPVNEIAYASCNDYEIPEEPEPLGLVASPNPATENISVTLNEKAAKSKAQNPVSSKVIFRLFETSTGRLQKEWTFVSGQAKYGLNVSQFKKGSYQLQVIKGKATKTTQIIIQR